MRHKTQLSFEGLKLVYKTGNLRKPDDYRDLYPMLGAYMVLYPKGNQMHFNYASPGSAEHYRRYKQFADGAVSVKGCSVAYMSKLRKDASAKIYER